MGPLSDRFGRRPVMLAGLALTAAASVLAISVGTVGSLIAARVLQALGASAGIVVSRAIIRDLFDRNRAAAMIGLVATVMVVVPTLGPLIGGLLDTGSAGNRSSCSPPSPAPWWWPGPRSRCRKRAA